jgi:cyclophilin family peptidyl-prolyl cis-trans isomerase
MIVAALLLAQAAPAAAAPLPSDPDPADWRPIPPDELLVMTLAGDRRVVVRLAPRLAPLHVENIRRLARAHWWDGLSVYRVQENWVAQWGDQSEKKPLPPGVAVRVPPEFESPAAVAAQRLAKADSYSDWSGVTADGWPVAGDGDGAAWATHCYGSVGVARDSDPASGSGAELFTPIGQSARRLDRNYTVVGRIVEGMAYLSALPRADTPMGMYADPKQETAIVSVRLASELPAAERPAFQYRAADNPRYAAAIRLKERPAPPTVPTGVAVCDLPVGVRKAP